MQFIVVTSCSYVLSELDFMYEKCNQEKFHHIIDTSKHADSPNCDLQSEIYNYLFIYNNSTQELFCHILIQIEKVY